MTDLPRSPEIQETENYQDFVPKQNLPVLVCSSFLLGGAILLFNSLIQPLVLLLDGSIAIVGILVSLFNFSRLIPQLIFGGYSDAIGRRRPMLIASWLLLVAGFFVITATHWLTLILPILLVGFAFALDQPASVAATAESSPRNLRGRAFAFLAAGRLMAGVIIALLGILVLQRGNVQRAFFLFIIFVGINLGLIYFLLIEPLRSPYPRSSILKTLQSITRIHPKLKNLYLYVVVADSFTYGIGWHLIFGLLVDFQGVSSQEILLYMLLTSLSGGLVQFGLVGRLVDRTRKWAIILSDSLAVPTFLVFALFPGGRTFLIAFVIMGIAVCFWRPAVHAFVVDHVEREQIAAEFGKIWGLKGIVGIIPPIVGGFLASTYGYKAPLLAGVVAGVFSILIAVFFLSGASTSSEDVSEST